MLDPNKEPGEFDGLTRLEMLKRAAELISEAGDELASAGDPVPDSLIKAYQMCIDLVERADNEDT